MDDLVNVGSDTLASRTTAFSALLVAVSAIGFSGLSVVLLAGVIVIALAKL